MMFDAQLILSRAQALTSSDVPSTNVIDLGAATPTTKGNWKAVVDKGCACVEVHVDTAFAGGTSIAISLQTDTDEAFGSPATLETRTVLLADLVADARFEFILPRRGVERYIRMFYDVTGTFTGGKIDADLVWGVQNPV